VSRWKTAPLTVCETGEPSRRGAGRSGLPVGLGSVVFMNVATEPNEEGCRRRASESSHNAKATILAPYLAPLRLHAATPAARTIIE